MEILKKGLLFGTESICMFAIYSLIPFTIEITSAAFLNVNLLTSDFYSVLVGIFLKNYKVCSHVFCKFSKPKAKFVLKKFLAPFVIFYRICMHSTRNNSIQLVKFNYQTANVIVIN
jgi:hypothetical protein